MTRPAADFARWTVAEDDFLAQHYHLHGARWCAAKLGRTEGAVKARAVRSGVALPLPDRWSVEQDGLLRQCWVLGGNVLELARRLGRSEDALYNRAQALGLARKKRWRRVVA